jgi:hypothetical protein
LELKAAAFLVKTMASYQKTKDTKKLTTACEKIIKLCPGTITAKKAKDFLKNAQ